MAKHITESDIRYFVDELVNDHSLTGWFTFATDDDYTWAIVFGWTDSEELDDGLLVKTAYFYNNSVMNDYEYDWYMPYDKKYGEVDDTESYYEDGPDLAERVIRDIPAWNREIDDFMKRYVGKYQE